MKDFLYLKDDQIREFLELLHNAYKKTNSLPKNSVPDKTIGQAQIRALKKIEKKPGISFSELMLELKVTKQSLNRVLKDLIKLDIIVSKKDEIDTRIKHVYLNDKGKKIFEEIFLLQKKRIYNAFLGSNSKEVISFDNVLKKIINEKL